MLLARPESLRERIAAVSTARVVVVDEVQRAPGVLMVVHAMSKSGADAGS
jgi:hypothetical protein